MLALEFTHELNQRLHTFDRHRVIDRCPHATDRTVALELRQPRRFGFLDEDLVEIGIAQRERNVHQRTVILRHRRVIELGLVEIIVKQCGLGAVDLLHRGHTALLFQPLEHQPCDINAIGRRRIRHRIVFRLNLVIEYGGRDWQGLAQQIIALGLSVREAEQLSRDQTVSKEKTAPEKDANLAQLERQLSDLLGLKVEIADKGRKGGALVISYKSLDQLDEVCRKLGAD